ncbi:alpha/beta hydrolase [Branchiibius sp. NY16-3462-2]|uniref:alpha/beta fold hydrolase n=1 Tax=Branchiibius sp. NY16-3462-2 TaxID=1807500 RepID=UPI0007985253|nr:alpha/beta hydrolase [Branchiibius sp. NY16-3462-2]KYH44936.1 hypothetical protein AZH51_13605 [Branchiibius sp. NY16-3462-2]
MTRAFLDLADGGRLAYRLVGDRGPVVLWVHGLPLDSDSWRLQLHHFAGRTRNVLVDLRGYGASSPLPEGADKVTQLYVDDLSALSQALGLDDVTVVGFASGGHVALRYAAENPRAVDRLVVINASPRFMRGPDWPFGFDESGIAYFVQAATDGRIEAMTDAVLDPALVFRDVDTATADRISDWFRPMSLAAGVRTLLGFFESIARDDDRDLLRRIEAPTLILASTAGQEVPVAVGRYLADQIATSYLVELPHVDHFAFATRPDLVNELIAQMLSGPAPDVHHPAPPTKESR